MTQTEWETVDRAAAVLKRLANPMRLRLLTALRGGAIGQRITGHGGRDTASCVAVTAADAQ
jgi:hypothetical protein